MEKSTMKKEEILEGLSHIPGKVESIRLYLKNIYAVKHFSFGSWTSRQHVFVAVTAQGKTGFAESIMSVNQPEATLEPWRKRLQTLIGQDVGEAILSVRAGQKNCAQNGNPNGSASGQSEKQEIWPEQLIEMTEMALIDLGGKIVEKPALHLLGLEHQHAVYGVHVILSDNLDEVDESTHWAKDNGKERFIKVKLFGQPELDCNVIRTVRRTCPRGSTYLIGDVNCGYRTENAQVSLDEIVEHMNELYEAGLDACEDPAFLDIDEWVELQSRVGNLEIIPDYPMRHNRCSIHQIRVGMGEIYNIHPDSSGSIVDAIALAGRIDELGAGLMIGDDSLVGPSASIWQQLAAGLAARWVEATEKRNESDFYYCCVKSLATDSRYNPIRIDLKDGFGIDLDEAKLTEEVDLKEEVNSK